MDLLTTYTHDSELQALAAPSPISTIHKPQHPLSLPQSAVSSPAVPWQRLLTEKIFQLHTLKFSLHTLRYRAHLFAPFVFKITTRHGPRRNTPFPAIPLLLLRERVYRTVAWKRLWYICLSRGSSIVTALHATRSFSFSACLYSYCMENMSIYFLPP
jgi:hypothetical protein